MAPLSAYSPPPCLAEVAAWESTFFHTVSRCLPIMWASHPPIRIKPGYGNSERLSPLGIRWATPKGASYGALSPGLWAVGAVGNPAVS